MAYDFSDPEIATMVKVNHRPTELPAETNVAVTTKVEPIPLVVVCSLDHEVWPCSAVKALREHEGKDGRSRLATGRGGRITAAEALAIRIAQGKIVS